MIGHFQKKPYIFIVKLCRTSFFHTHRHNNTNNTGYFYNFSTNNLNGKVFNFENKMRIVQQGRPGHSFNMCLLQPRPKNKAVFTVQFLIIFLPLLCAGCFVDWIRNILCIKYKLIDYPKLFIFRILKYK